MVSRQEPVRAGIVGCGNISPIYFQASRRFEAMEIVACADLVPERARARAAEFGVRAASSVEELLESPDLDLIINLTVPLAHASVALAALEAGKSVYGEKPLAVSLTDGKRVLEKAASRGLRVGCAPDTFLGGGHQTCRRLVDEGAIGRPVAATAFMLSPGVESWHPNPEFYYQPGGGPMFDMGPYYLTALINLLGPVRRVTGSARRTHDQRVITAEHRRGEVIPVEVPTHVAAVLDFHSGAVATLVTSFDVQCHGLPNIELYGTEGTLSIPDPNCFGGPVRLWDRKRQAWHEVELTHGYADNSRGLGAADLAQGLRSGRPHRAAGEMALHALEIMHAVHVASEEGRHVELATTCERPAPLRADLPDGVLDA